MPLVGPESTLGEVPLLGPGVATTVETMGIGQETAKQATGETSATDAGSAGTLSAIAATVQGQIAGRCFCLLLFSYPCMCICFERLLGSSRDMQFHVVNRVEIDVFYSYIHFCGFLHLCVSFLVADSSLC